MTKIQKIIETGNVIKVGKSLLGIRVDNDVNNFSSKKQVGQLSLLSMNLETDYFVEINLKTDWVFLFSEIIDVYNKIDTINFYSHQWKYEDSIIRLTYKQNENTLLMIKKEDEEPLNFVLEITNYFELISKIIQAIQNIRNFKFSLLNMEDSTKNLSIARIDDKRGTIITTFNGVVFGKPHLTESDKYQIRSSAIHRILFGRWLSVHAERINISFDGIITTVDEEYVLDTCEKNKSTFTALVLLSSLCFK